MLTRLKINQTYLINRRFFFCKKNDFHINFDVANDTALLYKKLHQHRNSHSLE